ncbi:MULTISPECIES: TIGR01777 family oxidoreductase [Pseudoalteromonas]|uniref:TIGR01777 family oxidoreductase n=1 Tax=Pseudoalteromonas TaxID=53246 RepID=UPI000FFE961F|nr:MULTISPECIES: TIGR01777 family oxidoreductase [Pseudoalteromonas]MCG9758632.1 TIGR01777 family oxidoreductase [Pseudoalteromonas sp. Isolate6]NKC18882.1 TIGR01777 family protein [Pseudoalteromonas galatheae]RXE87492.1 TIGR01777 family protein [Pseudoalteromonas sp. A757]
MNIFITGATGLIGKKLCQFLIHKHNLTALTRSPSKSATLLPNGVNCVTNTDDIDFNKLDAVINLAGEPIADGRWSNKKKQEIYNSRIKITEQIVAAINTATSPPKVFISGSAIGFYGRQPDDLAITEDFKDCHDEFSHRLCRDWENTAFRAESSQTRVCILRTGIVLSKSGGALAKMLPPFRLGFGGPIGSGDQVMSWIHIDDMIQSILYILKHDEIYGAINATAPNPVSNKQLSQALARSISRPCLFTVPPFALKLAYGEMSELLLYGQRVVPKKLLDTGYRFRHDDIEDALNALNL